MSIARHHAEWLSLLEISGPFLSMPVLMRVFPQGLDVDDSAHAGELRAAYEEWADNQGGLSPDPSTALRASPAIHTAWIKYILAETLGLPDELLAERQSIPEGLKATLPEHGEALRPDAMLVSPSAGQPRLLIQVYPTSQSLDKIIPDRPWKANPATRMMELLRQTGVRLGLSTNGEAWLLVSAKPGETTGYITWYAGLWGEERLTLRAFRSLLGLRRFFGVPDDQTLEALLDTSLVDQQEVTDQLGYQVRRAVEILVASLDRADQDAGRGLLSGIGESVLYEASLTVMMRLVFLLSAEERGLLLLGDPLYDQYYAASTLRAQLHDLADQQGEEVLERRFDAWSRLLATFRAVHGGIQHENLRLTAYGGSLFDPDRFPFLEGRTWRTRWREALAHPLPINNRTVLHLLDALQMLQVKVPGGGPAEARRLSFRALDIEQIGHVYEGLLDHTAIRAAQPVAGLAGTRDREPEIPLARLEAEQAKGSEAFIAYLKEQTGRSESALRKALGRGDRASGEETSPLQANLQPSTFNVQLLRAACGNDEALHRRVLAFAGLIRDDDFGHPIVIPAGSVYVTAGADRRSSGTHYTPRVLTEPIVEHTLEPLVYIGPAEGWPREKWLLRSPTELLALKICDESMGSGAFLVQVDRYLAERLAEAWEAVEQGLRAEKPDTNSGLLLITPEGDPTDDPAQAIPADPDDRLILARRLVAERCLYGVDKNPLAVEMAKLSLWLVTMAKGRPFDFLDHALKCGDSLIGVDEQDFLAWSQSLRGPAAPLYFEENAQALALARAKRRQLAAFLVNDVADAEAKARLLAEAEAAVARVKRGCDLLVGVQLVEGLNDVERETWRSKLLIEHTAKETLTSDEAKRSLAAARKHNAFHWFLEFPEVFEGGGVLAAPRSGFHGFVGNPPFIGGRRIRETLGDDYRDALYRLYPGSSGNADYCAFFFLRAFARLRHGGTLGLIATNTIAQGDTRQTGLEKIVIEGGIIYRASNNMPWPGEAAVAVDVVHISRGGMRPAYVLDGKAVEHISSLLDSRLTLGEPKQLAANQGMSFQGSLLRGMGFLIVSDEAETLIAEDVRNAEVIQPYVNGDDLNSEPDQTASRWVINFFDWPVSRAQTYSGPYKILEQRVYPVRMADEEARKTYEKMWWQFWRPRVELYETIRSLPRVLACSRVSKYLSFALVSSRCVYSDATVVVASDKTEDLAIVQSGFHELWARKFSSSLETRLRYSPTDAFQTFPRPRPSGTFRGVLSDIGETYHEHRRLVMLTRKEGLTDTYNRFHDTKETAADIARLREMHVQMDQTVAAAYGWDDLDLGHGFHTTAQGERYTISESARREVLERLLALNHQRYEEEVAAGLHEKDAKAKRQEGATKARRLAESGPIWGKAAENNDEGSPRPSAQHRGRKKEATAPAGEDEGQMELF